MSHTSRLSFDRMVYVRPGSTQSITLFTIFSLDEPVKTLGRTRSLDRAEAMCRGDQPLEIEPHSFVSARVD